MKIKLSLFFLLLCLCQYANAQNADTAFYRHHIGIITSPILEDILTSNRELPVGVIYRLQHKANSTFRATLMGSHNNLKFSSTFSPNERKERINTYLQFTGGYEWQQPVNSNWQFYYGAEAGAFIRRMTTNDPDPIIYSYDPAEWTIDVVEQTLGIFMRPFAGIALKLSRRLYLASETAILVRHQRREANAFITPRNLLQQGDWPHNYANGIWRDNSIYYQPLSNISLLLRF